MAPFIDVDVNISHINTFVCEWFNWQRWITFCISQSLLQEPEDHVLMDRVFHVLKLYLWRCTLHCLSWAIGVRRCSLITLFLELLHAQVSLCYDSIFLSAHWCYFHSFSFIGIHQIDQILQILWRVFLTPRPACYQVEWSRLHQKCWFRLRYWWPFTSSRS